MRFRTMGDLYFVHPGKNRSFFAPIEELMDTIGVSGDLDQYRTIVLVFNPAIQP